MRSMKQATLCFLLRGDDILLAMKKKGFGAGKWNGVGGKFEEGETPEQCARREIEEELGVRATGMDRVAHLRFFFPDTEQYKDWNFDVHVFMVNSWEGEPREGEEVAPQWYSTKDIPFAQMWADDPHWLPRVLAGEKLAAEFHYADDSNIASHSIRVLEA